MVLADVTLRQIGGEAVFAFPNLHGATSGEMPKKLRLKSFSWGRIDG